MQFQPEDDYVRVGTCMIHTYSEHGMAHCLDHDLIIKGGEEILASCTFEMQGYPDEVYTGGQYEWLTNGKKEGFKFVKVSTK